MEGRYERERRATEVMNSSMTNTDVEQKMRELLVNLQEEYAMYECMIELCKQEHQFIEKGDWASLRTSLGKKNKLLDSIMTIEGEIGLLKEEWNRQKDIRPSQLKDKIVAQLKNFKQLMEQLVALQTDNETTLQQRNLKEAEMLGVIRKGKNLNRAYSAYGNTVTPARYMDKIK
ncbi:MAG: flagellar protein FlgN [Candidatus Omnitrophica bacterium]|nr:flagellar protein FlgN [Candidatus Omnitrophota bacterium]